MARLLTCSFDTQDDLAEGVAGSTASYSTSSLMSGSGLADLLCSGSVYKRWDTNGGPAASSTNYISARCVFTAFTTHASWVCPVMTVGGDFYNGVGVDKNGVLSPMQFDGVNLVAIGAGTAQLALNVEYLLEMKVTRNGANQITEITVRLNGAQIGTWTGTSSADVSLNQLFLGDDAGTGGQTVRFGTLIVNDSTGGSENTFRGDHRVACMLWSSDNALGTGWEAPQTTGSDTTAIGSAIDNTPPVGVAHSDADANNQKYIFNAASNATTNADFNLPTYTAAGVTGAVRAVQLIACTGSSSATDTAGALRIVSNPAQGAEDSFAAFDNGVAGTHPTNWRRVAGTVQYSPAPTLGTAVVVRVGKRTATTRVAMVDLLVLLVDYSPASLPVQPRTQRNFLLRM